MRAVWGLVFAVGLVVLGGCAGKTLTEQQRYEKLQDGFKYRAYRKVSKEGLEPAIEEVNKQRIKKGKDPVSLGLAHAITGFAWSMAQKPDFALAEYALALPESDSLDEEYAARTTGAIAFYQKNWHQLARTESQQVRTLLAEAGVETKYERKQAIAHLIVGSLAVMEGDTELAGTSFMFVGTHIEKPWLGIIAQSAAYITSNKWSESMRLLSSLVKSGQLPEAERALISGWVEEGERSGADKKIRHYLQSQLKTAFMENDEVEDIWQAVEGFKDKVKL